MLPSDPVKRKEFFNFINRGVVLKEREDKIKEEVKEDLSSLKEEVEELIGEEFGKEFVSKVNTKHKLNKETEKANKILEQVAELEILEQNHVRDTFTEVLARRDDSVNG